MRSRRYQSTYLDISALSRKSPETDPSAVDRLANYFPNPNVMAMAQLRFQHLRIGLSNIGPQSRFSLDGRPIFMA